MAKTGSQSSKKYVVISGAAVAIGALIAVAFIATTSGGKTSVTTPLLNMSTEQQGVEKITALQRDILKLQTDNKQLATKLNASVALADIPALFRGNTTQDTLRNLNDAERTVRRYDDDAAANITFLDDYIKTRFIRPSGGAVSDLAVKDLYRRLAVVLVAVGRFESANDVTGSQLRDAVKAIQADHQLRADGVVGTNTWAIIKKMYQDAMTS